MYMQSTSVVNPDENWQEMKQIQAHQIEPNNKEGVNKGKLFFTFMLELILNSNNIIIKGARLDPIYYKALKKTSSNHLLIVEGKDKINA